MKLQHYGHEANVVHCSNCGAAWCIDCTRTCTVCHFDTRKTSTPIGKE